MTPSRRDRLKPVEYLVFAGVAGLFSAGVVLLTIRKAEHAAIIGGIAFIVTLVVIATLTLAARPASDEHATPSGGDDDANDDAGDAPRSDPSNGS